MGAKGKLVRFYSTVSDRSEVVHLISKLFSGDGGPGSGNFGHKGRPGEVGGSGPGGGSGGAEQKSGKVEPTKKFLSSGPDEIKTARERASENVHGDQYSFFSRYMRGILYGEGDGHDAMNYYGFSGDVMMNNLLRSGSPRTYEQQVEWKNNLEKTKKSIDDLTSVIDKNELRSTAVVFRGIRSYSGLSKVLGLNDQQAADMQKLLSDDDFIKSLVGQTFSDPAFTSTSIDKEFPRKGGFSAACEMEVVCPAGTKGVYFGDQGRFTDEHEFLLQRGTQFVITSASVEPKWNDEKRLLLTVSVVDQVPKDVPEKYTAAFAEEREEIKQSIASGAEIPQQKLEELFPSADPDVLSELNSLRNKERDVETTERIWGIVALQRELDLVTDIEAAELESYAMKLDRFTSSDSYRRERKNLDEKLKEFSDGKLEGQSEAEARVREKYPDASDKAFPLLVIHQAEADRLERVMKRDIELYGDEGSLTNRKKRAIEEEKRAMEYIAKKAG